VRELGEWSEAARLALGVIDIREMAQRNLQSALAARRGEVGQASAALMVHGAQCLLTICANGELFYARRLEWRPEWIAATHAPAEAPRVDLMASGFADLDIVDYSDAGTAGLETHDDVPPLMIELQRSFDVWERSWPDLPLRQLLVHANGHTSALIGLLEPVTPMAVVALDLEPLFKGLDAAAGAPAVASAVTPLLGALLRDESRPL
jgi:MSHA biogenesis protein MshI